MHTTTHHHGQEGHARHVAGAALPLDALRGHQPAVLHRHLATEGSAQARLQRGVTHDAGGAVGRAQAVHSRQRLLIIQDCHL